jgi:hypothetical protein
MYLLTCTCKITCEHICIYLSRSVIFFYALKRQQCNLILEFVRCKTSNLHEMKNWSKKMIISIRFPLKRTRKQRLPTRHLYVFQWWQYSKYSSASLTIFQKLIRYWKQKQSFFCTSERSNLYLYSLLPNTYNHRCIAIITLGNNLLSNQNFVRSHRYWHCVNKLERFSIELKMIIKVHDFYISNSRMFFNLKKYF